MSDTYSGDLNAGDIDDGTDRPSTRLDQEADRILSAGRADDAGAGGALGRDTGRPVESVRAAVREDLTEGRQWAEARGGDVAEAIREEPIRATMYALGLGVLIGLLLRR